MIWVPPVRKKTCFNGTFFSACAINIYCSVQCHIVSLDAKTLNIECIACLEVNFMFRYNSFWFIAHYPGTCRVYSTSNKENYLSWNKRFQKKKKYAVTALVLLRVGTQIALPKTKDISVIFAGEIRRINIFFMIQYICITEYIKPGLKTFL